MKDWEITTGGLQTWLNSLPGVEPPAIYFHLYTPLFERLKDYACSIVGHREEHHKGRDGRFWVTCKTCWTHLRGVEPDRLDSLIDSNLFLDRLLYRPNAILVGLTDKGIGGW